MSSRREFKTLENGLIIWKWSHKDTRTWGVAIPEKGGGYTYREDNFSRIVVNGDFVLAAHETYKPGRDTRYHGYEEFDEHEVYDYTEVYLLNRVGDKMHLDKKRYSNLKISCGNNPDSSIFFACSYDFIRYSEAPSRYHQAVDTYNVYPQEGKDYVDVEVISQVDGKFLTPQAYRLWFTGKREPITPRELTLKPNA